MPGGNTDPLAASYSLPRSHLTNTRSGVWENADSRIFIGNGFQANTGTADLLTACVVVSSVTARYGDAPDETPSRQPKSLASPPAPIYEMTCKRCVGLQM